MSYLKYIFGEIKRIFKKGKNSGFSSVNVKQSVCQCYSDDSQKYFHYWFIKFSSKSKIIYNISHDQSVWHER